MRDAFKMQCEVFRSFMGIFMFLHTVVSEIRREKRNERNRVDN